MRNRSFVWIHEVLALFLLCSLFPPVSWAWPPPIEWHATSECPVPVSENTAVAHNGRLYVLGGFGAGVRYNTVYTI
ncbi:hypothetical protein JW916_08570, partial [Candidatus Sumerlaeota bacterium]|nr:hypothetical protein [Candidatus Sumerlaeota bacterium]